MIEEDRSVEITIDLEPMLADCLGFMKITHFHYLPSLLNQSTAQWQNIFDQSSLISRNFDRPVFYRLNWAGPVGVITAPYI